MARILVVDDESSLLEFLGLLFEQEGQQVSTAGSVSEARSKLQTGSYDLVLCDIMMPDGSGLDLLREIKEVDPRTSVIMMTAYTSTKSAIEAMKLGAYDYVSKPFDVDELKVLVERAIEKAALLDENLYLRRELEQKYTFANIIGRSSRMQNIFGLVDRIARTSSTVLIHGESGTGKELIARAIHFASARASRRFLSINCGALPENLLESELFGHERGAFTGAVREKKGLFQEADKGTLFLDEIGEMVATMQVKLLRALQEKKVRKVGGNREESVDVRIIAATNRDLKQRIESGDFREDLYYRINVIPIDLPALRERREDIPLLVDHFVRKYSADMGTEPTRIASDAMQALEAYDWPGNVRELENLVERALALATSQTITLSDLPLQIRHRDAQVEPGVDLPAEGLDLEAYLEAIRAQMMRLALERSSWVQTQAAELLGMTFRSFRYYARKAGLTGGRQN
jgi:two-component system response regulator PilR (NtrC family)